MAKKKVEETPVAEVPLVEPVKGVLTPDQEINALRAAHTFFSDFDRVPGALAAQWAQALDAVGLVYNSLYTKKEQK